MSQKLIVILALLAMLVVIGVELGAGFLPPGKPLSEAETLASVDEEHRDEARRQRAEHLASPDAPPGLAPPALALLDGLLAYAALLVATASFTAQDWHSRVRAVATPVVSIIVLLVGLVMLFAAIAKLMLMLSLLLSPPFGLIAYLAVFGSFNSSAVGVMLGLATLFRAVFAGLLLFASLRYLKNKVLVLLTATAFLGGLIIGLLNAFLPGVLHSIGDAVSAIVIAVLAIIWAILLLLMSIPGIIKILRVDRLA